MFDSDYTYRVLNLHFCLEKFDNNYFLGKDMERINEYSPSLIRSSCLMKK